MLRPHCLHQILVYFYYKGRANSIFSMSSPNLLEQVVVKLASNRDDRSRYLDLLRLLSNLNCSNTMVLYLPSEKALFFPKHTRKICYSTLPDLKHLKVKIHDAISRHTELDEALRRFAPSVQMLEIKRQSYQR